MFIGRTQELKNLEEHYSKPESQLLVVYGREGIGKTDLLRILLNKRPGRYYMARECSEKEQILCLLQEWEENYKIKGCGGSLSEVFSSVNKNQQEKQILVIDEFHYMAKNCGFFSEALIELLHAEQGLVMVILCSSSVNWVENDMVKALAGSASYISALLKVRELSFVDVVNRFPDSSMSDCISIYGILGGIPKYLNYWNPKLPVKDNVKLLILNREGRLYREVQNFLKSELRELSLYHTILAAMAADTENMKLHNLYERTGFSRAKISVYLKNLMEIGIVEKVFSYGSFGEEHTKKGLYRIKEHFIHFWYKYVFPNLSQLENCKAETVFQSKIEPTLSGYLQSYFAIVCKEYLELLSTHGRMPFVIEKSGTWFGKEGTIDYVAEGADSGLLAAACRWERTPMTWEDFMKLLSLLNQAGMEPDYYYLFSKSGFTAGMEAKSRDISNIKLIEAEQM